jgi:hypothetical protein
MGLWPTLDFWPGFTMLWQPNTIKNEIHVILYQTNVYEWAKGLDLILLVLYIIIIYQRFRGNGYRRAKTLALQLNGLPLYIRFSGVFTRQKRRVLHPSMDLLCTRSKQLRPQLPYQEGCLPTAQLFSKPNKMYF